MSNNRGFKESSHWDFSGGSVMGLHASTARGTSLIPGQRANNTQAMCHSQKKKEGKEIYKTYCVECWIPGRTYCKLVMTRGLESNELALNPASVTYWQCDSGWITHLSQPQFLHLDTLKMPISKVSMRSK